MYGSKLAYAAMLWIFMACVVGVGWILCCLFFIFERRDRKGVTNRMK